MKKTLIYIDEKAHRRLRYLAFHGGDAYLKKTSKKEGRR